MRYCQIFSYFGCIFHFKHVYLSFRWIWPGSRFKVHASIADLISSFLEIFILRRAMLVKWFFLSPIFINDKKISFCIERYMTLYSFIILYCFLVSLT
jgi:hypothetical protein